jgi:alpha-L-arabinofuranosidase
LLYRKHFGLTPLKIEYAPGDQHLDVAAALAEGGRALTLAVVNPSNHDARLTFEFQGMAPSGEARQWIVSGTDPRVTNDVENQRVQAVEISGKFDGEWSVPGFSFAILSVPL